MLKDKMHKWLNYMSILYTHITPQMNFDHNLLRLILKSRNEAVL